MGALHALATVMRHFAFAALLLAGGTAAAQPGAAQPAAAGPAAAAEPPPPGSISGRVVIAPGVPAQRCQVSGSGVTASCNKSGAFLIKPAPILPVDIKISVPGIGDVTVSAGAGEGQTTWLGDIQVGVHGAVSGVVVADNSSDLDRTIIGIPELGVYTQPSVTGGYLLSGVPGGAWNVTLYPPGQAEVTRSVVLGPGQVTGQVDFHIKGAPPPQTPTPSSH
jgi:hypothetical protein